MRFLARGFNDQGNAASRAGNNAEAERCWRQAVTLDPAFSAPWFNLGLLAKRRGDWPEVLRCNRAAVKADNRNTGAWWNLGIAATALRRWPEARQAWTVRKIPLPPGDGEPVADYGLVPVRLTSRDGRVEVVWGNLIDPARVRLRNVLRPGSDFRFGDVVLRDGAPDGETEFQGQKVPVFNALGLFEAAAFGTFTVVLQVSSERIPALRAAIQAKGWGLEDWVTVRTLAGGEADAAAAAAEAGALPEGCVRWAVAAPGEAALRTWVDSQDGVTLLSLEVSAPPRPASA